MKFADRWPKFASPAPLPPARRWPDFAERLERDLFEEERTKMGTTLQMPDGQMVEQGGPEDRATWWTCGWCGHTGPHVGTDKDGSRACLGSCGGQTENPTIPRLPENPK